MDWSQTQLPKDFLIWIEAHHGLAGWVEAFGVIGSLILTQRIASRELRTQRQNKLSYRKLLVEAFENMRAPLEYLSELNVTAPAHNPSLAVQGSTQETARQMTAAITRMQDAQTIVHALEDINRLDDFGGILAIFNARRMIEAAMPVFKKELSWLEAHPESENVVSSAVMTVGSHASDLVTSIDAVLSALKK